MLSPTSLAQRRGLTWPGGWRRLLVYADFFFLCSIHRFISPPLTIADKKKVPVPLRLALKCHPTISVLEVFY